MAQEKWILTGPKTIELGVIDAIRVGLIGGRIDIVAHDEPGALVEVHGVTDRDLVVGVSGGTLTIDHIDMRWDNILHAITGIVKRAKAEISVRVPRHVTVKTGTVSAATFVSGTTGGADLDTVSGSVIVDGVVGDLSVDAVSGELSVLGHTGAVNVNTVSGDVAVEGAVPKLKVDSVSGDVFADLRGEVDEIRSNSVSGDLTVRLEAGVPARYRITTMSGRTQLDGSLFAGMRGSFTSTYGEVGGGRWTDVSSQSVSGDVTVVHAEPAFDRTGD